jgi:hypothetical protein
MNGNGFDFSVVELSTLKLTPGRRVRLVVIDEISMEQSVLLDVSCARFVLDDDGARGEQPGMPMIVQWGFDFESSIRRRLRENQLRLVYDAGGKISIRVEPRKEGKVSE